MTCILDDDYCYLFPSIEVPKRFVVYFHEGNDIDDNQKPLINEVKPHAGDLAPQIEASLRDHDAQLRPMPAGPAYSAFTCCGF